MRDLPPFPRAVCLHCGITFRSNMTLPLIDGEPLPPQYLEMSCPNCGRMVRAIGDLARPKIHAEILTAIRDADLSATDLAEFARVLDSAQADASPREIAAAFPAANQIVVVASRAGPDWIARLSLIVAVLAAMISAGGVLWAHEDAERALDSAPESTQPTRTSELTDEDLQRLAEAIAAERAREEAKPDPRTPPSKRQSQGR